jgi:hypothetical protein
MIIRRTRRDVRGRCSDGEFFGGERRANALFVSAVAEGVPHFIFSQFATNRRLDHALVDCQDARGYHSRGDIHRILSAGLPALVEREDALVGIIRAAFGEENDPFAGPFTVGMENCARSSAAATGILPIVLRCRQRAFRARRAL